MRLTVDPRALPIRTQLVLGMVLCLAAIGTLLIVVIPSKEAEVLRRAGQDYRSLSPRELAGQNIPFFGAPIIAVLVS